MVEAVRRMFTALQGVLPFMPLLPLVVVLGMWGRIDTSLLLTWLIAALSVTALRFYLVRGYFADSEISSPEVWANRVGLSALWDGVIWGAAGAVFFLPDSVPHQVLMVTMVVGIPAGSVFVTSYWPRVQYAFAVPAVGVTAVKLMIVGSAALLGLGIGMLAYLVILHQIMRRAHDAAMGAIMLQFENLDLIDQLREQKEAAEQANIAKSQFLAAASHDLRQPLHALALFTESLQQKTTNAEQRGLVESISRCAGALDDLFQSLLDVSRLDAGIVESQPMHFKLRPMIERITLEYAPQARSHGVRFYSECDDLVAYSDPSLVERILLNITSNAVRYTPSGSIRIRVAEIKGAIRITITDTGVGIPSDMQEEVFREYIQLQNPERDRNKGLGLGLAIVRRMADLLDCDLELNSVPGRGTEFSFVLPLGDDRSLNDTAFLRPPDLGNQLAGKIIVVVDDESEVREGMRTVLQGWGCEAIVAEDAAGALQLLREKTLRPDLVIADYRLRDNVVGDQVIAEIQAQYDLRLPGIIITGDTAPERLQEAQASGYTLIHKPAHPAKLRALLTRVLAPAHN